MAALLCNPRTECSDVDFIPWTIGHLGAILARMTRDGEFKQMQGALAANLLRLRTAKGMSQEKLALNADVDRTYVSQLERKLKNPSLLILHRLAKVLDTNVITLLQQQ